MEQIYKQLRVKMNTIQNLVFSSFYLFQEEAFLLSYKFL